MDLFILIIVIIILCETTLLVFKNRTAFFSSKGRRKVFIDTSALIDGRILGVAKTGFLADELVIPRSVIHELQLLADSKDSKKRTRARLGMDTAKELERVVYCEVTVLEDPLDRTLVDDRLIELAKVSPNSAICTTDFNLGKVAAAENIDVLNVNDLAIALHDEHEKGDRFIIKITEKGTNRGQGVGHLDDGSMVIVSSGAKRIGEEVEVEVVRFVQSSTGRMIFARIV